VLPRRAKDSDTDPSTPEALRGPAVDTDPGLGPVAPVTPVIAQPGVSKPPPPLPARATAVTASASPGPKKDSVELLLEGMPAQQPQPPRTTPQTAGQSSAAYHVEHAVRPAHTSPDDVPKVVVERAPQHATVRLNRARLQAVIDQAQAEKASQAQLSQHGAGMPMSLRIAIAVVAGLAVVLGIFLVARPSADSAATVAPPPPPLTTVRPTSTAAAMPTVVPAPTATETPVAATDTVSATPAAPPVATSSSAKPRPRPTAPAATGSGGDLGEFKTTFH
jgi:hypothetical protein